MLAATAAPAQYKVLFIGNSFTFGDRVDGNSADDVSVPAIFEALALGGGQPAPLIGMSASGGRDFQYHAGMDGNVFQGTLDAIASQAWTHIVLQNFSTEPTHIVDGTHSVNDHLTYGGALYLVAMDLNPKPTVLLYETWGRAAAHGIYTGASTNSTFVDPDEFQNELWFNYRRLADLLNAAPGNAANPRVKIAPVGDTWQTAGALLPAGNPDFINLFASDNYHGNDSGYYLSAAVIYSRIYGVSSVGLNSAPQVAALGLTLSSATFLEQVAWAVVTSNTELVATYLVDFGANGSPTGFGAAPDDPVYYWNNVTQTIGTSASGQVSNLVTAANASSTVALAIDVPFSSSVSNGTTSSTLFAGNASGDSLFGHAADFNSVANVFPRFVVSNLNAAHLYTFTFYASRAGVGDNRETKYTVAGATSGVALLNAANNVNHSATVFGIAPTSTGEISVTIDAGSNNNNVSKLTYLGALRIDEHGSAPTITSSATANGTFGSSFSYIITASDTPTSYGATGLPPGLSVNPTSGLISGTPSLAGAYTATISAANNIGTGQAALTLTVGKATASVTLGGLSQTYDGSPRAITATTAPTGLTVAVTYAGSVTVPTAAGSYAVVATIVDTNYQGSANGTLTVGKATAPVTLGSLSQTYDGSPRPITATTAPTGLTVSVTYAGSVTVPSVSGSYAVVATIVDANYQGSANGTLTVGKATAPVTLGSLSQTYDGSPRPITATTAPTGLTVAMTYAGSVTVPTAAGSYAVVATIVDANYQGSANGTLTVGKATAPVTLGSLSQTYDGSPRTITVTTAPTGLTVPVTYAGSGTAPTAVGSYAVMATVVDFNYQGSANGTLTVGKATASVTLGSLSQTYNGSPRAITTTTAPAGLTVAVTYAGSATAPSAAGSYPVAATVVDPSYAGSATGTLVIGLNSRLVNMSARTQVGTGDDVLIQGFVVTGTGTKTLLIRGIGPTLTTFNVPGALIAPTLTLVSNGSDLASNTGWSTSPDAAAIEQTAAAVNAFPLPSGSGDSALLVTLAPGVYSAKLSGVGGTTGVGLVEIYDADVGVTDTRLANLSARARVGTGADVLIPGFVASGAGARRYLVRAIGPTLGTFNVAGALVDPKLTIFAGVMEVVSNDDWSSAANAVDIVTVSQQVQAFALADGSKDAVALVTLPPGEYTVVVSGVGETSGVALVEIYEVLE